MWLKATPHPTTYPVIFWEEHQIDKAKATQLAWEEERIKEDTDLLSFPVFSTSIHISHCFLMTKDSFEYFKTL